MLSHFLSSVRSALGIEILKPAEKLRPRPKLALVLSGGGARGLAHVGVLEELEKAGIAIELIVGCSSGSLVGALYADHQNALTVKNVLFSLRKRDLINYNFLSSRYGLAKGGALRKVLQTNLSCSHFEELKIPFISVATDLQTGELVVLNTGPIVPAVHASCAIPFYFEPVTLHNRILVDGGVVDSVPTSVAKKHNPELIVAVDLNQSLKKSLPTHLFGVAKRSWEIVLFHQSKRCLTHADVVIKPELQNVGIFDGSNNHGIYEAGRKAALKEIPQILKSLSSI